MTNVRWWLDAVLLDRVDRLGDPVQGRVGADRHVGAEHVVVDRADQARRACSTGWRSAADLVIPPCATSSASSSGHSCRNRSAPVRLPSPPITTSASMPRLDQVRRPPPAPSRVRNSLRPGGADHGAAPVQDPADVAAVHRSDQVAAVDHALVALVDGVDVDATVQARSATTARTAAFMPWASPPLVSTPILVGVERVSTIRQAACSVTGLGDLEHVARVVLDDDQSDVQGVHIQWPGERLDTP